MLEYKILELYFLCRIILTVSDKLSFPIGPHYVNLWGGGLPLNCVDRVYLLWGCVRFSERKKNQSLNDINQSHVVIDAMCFRRESKFLCNLNKIRASKVERHVSIYRHSQPDETFASPTVVA
jgi:hypothetical protein